MTESIHVWGTQPSFSLWRCVGGWILVVLGAAGLLLPVLPGTPLLIAGLVMLSADYPWARNYLRKLKRWARRLRKLRRKPAIVH